jgi:hypothetical protein
MRTQERGVVGVDDDDPHGDVSVPVMLAVLSVELDRTREPLT